MSNSRDASKVAAGQRLLNGMAAEIDRLMQEREDQLKQACELMRSKSNDESNSK